jgi:hypothetical protein
MLKKGEHTQAHMYTHTDTMVITKLLFLLKKGKVDKPDTYKSDSVVILTGPLKSMSILQYVPPFVLRTHHTLIEALLF